MKYATLIVSVLIMIAVLIPGRSIPSVGVGGFDKIVHFGMFMTWALAVRYDITREPFPYWRVLFFGVCFSAFTECVQILAEDRTFDLYDMAADAAGLIVGLLISRRIINWIKTIL